MAYDVAAASWQHETQQLQAKLADTLHDLQVAVGPGYTTTGSAAVEAARRIGIARAKLDRVLVLAMDWQAQPHLPDGNDSDSECLHCAAYSLLAAIGVAPRPIEDGD